MAEKNIILKASDYQYPSQKELKQVYATSPDLHNFGFRSDTPIISLLSSKHSIPEVHKMDHLNYWDRTLLNRNGSLSHSYQNAIVHFMRGIPDDLKTFQHTHYINRIQFDYYAENFYYYFSTVTDTIGQLLNVYYDLNFEVEKLHFNKNFLKKLSNNRVIELTDKFFSDTKKAKEFRNGFTHRNPVNYPDSRSSISFENGQYSYGSASNNFVVTSKIKSNLDDTFQSLAEFLKQLKLILIERHDN